MAKRKHKKKPYAKRSLGQNFLINDEVIERIILAVSPSSEDLVVEIGAGKGALTRELVNSGASVVAIEIDKDLVPFLRVEFEKAKNFALIEESVLDLDLASVLQASGSSPETTKLVGNLPYNISTPILQYLIGHRTAFSSLLLMLQKEVVERITAKPGTSERGFLTVLIERYFDSEELFDVAGTAFFPVPKVESSVVRLTPKPVVNEDAEFFRNIISTSFMQKRKTLKNNFEAASDEQKKRMGGEIQEILLRAGIDGKRRAESLSGDEWQRLYLAAKGEL